MLIPPFPSIRENLCLSVAGLISCCLFGLPVYAGDAVAIGYNSEGVWIMVTYYCSSTPQGGKDYKDSTQAREAVLRDLRRRAGHEMAKANVIAQSDVTGYAAVARGETQSGKDVTAVGRGKSPDEAERKALADLNRVVATAKQKIVYRYFSHGADSAAKP